MMRVTRIFAAAAVCLAAVSAQAQETWDETLRNTVTAWWNTARTTARVATLNPVTLNMCWASDKNALAADTAIVAGFQKRARVSRALTARPHSGVTPPLLSRRL